MTLRIAIETGEIFHLDKAVLASDLIWNDHAKFKGVAIKHLVKGEDTGGKFSCHLVRVEGGHQIGAHIHDSSFELHEVLEGAGVCELGEKKIAYKPGVTVVIPSGVTHSVTAEKELYLLAKYFPAMV